MAKKQLPVRIDEAVLKKLQELAKKDNRPLSNYIETVLKNHVNGKREFNHSIFYCVGKKSI